PPRSAQARGPGGRQPPRRGGAGRVSRPDCVRLTAMSSEGPLFERLALIGVGLIGSSIARAARQLGLARTIVATARSAATRRRVTELGLADQVADTNAATLEGADLGIVCIPVGPSGPGAEGITPHLAPPAP